MIIGVLREPDFETRVSLLAESISSLIKRNITVWVEAGAGDRSFCNDDEYAKEGAGIRTRQEILAGADLLAGIHHQDFPPTVEKKILVGVFQPLFHAGVMAEWASRGITSFSLDMLPRTTRAQSMDVLSSQANIAGYKAVIRAADLLPRYFPMFMTAAGTIPPARVLILGAGVAGLQAIATARRLGAVVEVFDTRPAVKEEVMSLGGKFIEVEGAADASRAGGYAVQQSDEFRKKQQEKIQESLVKADVVITTAQIPGKKAPILLTKNMVESMKKGAVIIDLAAATGGNTELTSDNGQVMHNGVLILGDSNLASSLPSDASRLYGRNLLQFLQLLIDKENNLQLRFEDDLVSGACITHGGQVVHEKVKALV